MLPDIKGGLSALAGVFSRLDALEVSVPRPRWGQVVSANPLTVKFDGAVEAVPVFASLTPVGVDDRVYALFALRRAVIVGASHAENTIVAGGRRYPASGSWAVSVSSWAIASDPYAATLQLIAPFVPPEGWAFHCYVLVSSSFTFVDTAAYSEAQNRVQVRVLQRGNNSLTALSRVGWELVKQ